MARFKSKRPRRGVAISTASLPDIIFMLLFFFMVSTVMRESELLVQVEQPEADETVKLENRSLVDYIYVGAPIDRSKGSNPRIQLNDHFGTVQEVQNFIDLKRKNRPENQRDKAITALKVDARAEMGIVSDIKQELRKVNALKICYSTLDGAVLAETWR